MLVSAYFVSHYAHNTQLIYWVTIVIRKPCQKIIEANRPTVKSPANINVDTITSRGHHRRLVVSACTIAPFCQLVQGLPSTSSVPLLVPMAYSVDVLCPVLRRLPRQLWPLQRVSYRR